MVRLYYNSVIENEKQTAITGSYFITEAYESDLLYYQTLGILSSMNKKRIFLEYSLRYQNKNIYLHEANKIKIKYK